MPRIKTECGSKRNPRIGAVIAVGAIFCTGLVACADQEQVQEQGTVVQQPAATQSVARPSDGPDMATLVTSDKGAEVRGFDADGLPVKGARLSVANIADTQMLPFADGYAVPDKDSIALVTSQLKKAQAVEVAEVNRSAELASAATSHNHAAATFAFNLPPEEGGTVERTRIVRMHSSGGSVEDDLTSQVITRKGNISSLTSCDDGSAAWLEFNPVSLFDPEGSGLASVVTWNEQDGVESYPLDYTFMGRPWDANQLDCDFKHHRLIAPDGTGGIINLGVQLKDAEYKVVGRRTIKKGDAADIDGDNAMIRGDYFTTISDDGKVSVLNMYKGAVVDDVQFRKGYLSSREVVGASQDGEFFYVLFEKQGKSAQGKSAQGSVVVMDYSSPQCRVSHDLSLSRGESVAAAFAQGDGAIPKCAQ